MIDTKDGLEHGEGYLRFVAKTYKKSIITILITSAIFIFAFSYHTDIKIYEIVNSPEMKSLSFWASLFFAFSTFLLAVVNTNTAWINSFPSYMNVKFYREGMLVDKFNACDIFFIGESDIRSIAQQVAKSKNNDKWVELKPYFEVRHWVDQNARQKRYSVKMYLRPEKKDKMVTKIISDEVTINIEQFKSVERSPGTQDKNDTIITKKTTITPGNSPE